MKRLVDGIYHLPLAPFINAYVLEGKDGLTLVDAGLKGNETAAAKQLAEHGYSLGAIERVIITHAHPDHVGSLPEILDVSGAEVWAHRLDAPIIRGAQPLATMRPDPATLPLFDRLTARFSSDEQPTAPVARELGEGEVLDEVLPGLRVVHLPGHSPGQIGLWLEAVRLLIGADVMMHLPWGLRMPPRGFTADWAEAGRSVAKVASMGVATLCLGHGKPILDDAATRIDRVAERLR